MSLDLAAVRAQFPILAEPIHGKRLVYLDSGASAQKPLAVLDKMDWAHRHAYANVHRGLHTLANRATEAYEGARETVRGFLNAGRVEEIVFTKSATEAINLVASSFASPLVGEGDEIVLSIMEHHSNIVPWHFLRERQGAVLRWVDVREDGSFDLEAFAASLNERTKLVAITHMSNVLGTVVPIAEVIALAHARGIKVLIDGSQGAVHTKVDVQALDADFYVMTGHKLYGPNGIGVLYGKSELLAQMRPYQGGGGMIEHVSVDAISYGKTPHKFEAGTPAIVEAIGLGAALNYMMQVGRENIARHESELRSYAHARLADLPWLKVYGTAPGKGAIVSFTMEGLHAHDIATIVDRSGVAVRAGHHCAQPLMERLGVTAVARASFAMYNTRQEVDALVAALERAHELFA